MSIRIMSLAWDADLPATQKLVLLSLADQANDDGVCWPSAAKTSSRTGLCERATRKAISDLEDAGHITRQERAGRSTYYIVHPCSKCTPAANAPLQQMHPPLHQMQDTPASGAPITVKEPSKNPSSSSSDSTPAPNAGVDGVSLSVVRAGPSVVVKFTMYDDWLPSDSISHQLLASGCREPWLPNLAEFVTFWAGRPGTQETQAGWDNKFLKNVIRQASRREARLA